MSAAVLTAGAVTIPPPAADSPDADLIRLATEYVALSRESYRLGIEHEGAAEGSPERAQMAAVVARLLALPPTIAALPAITEEGQRAKAAVVLHQVTSDVARLADGPDEADDAPAHSLALDLLRPRGTVALAPDPGASAGAIAERAYSLYRESLTFDCGTAKRVQMGNQAAGDELARLQSEAFDLMDQAMDFPAASLTDVVALLDFALSEVDGIGAVVEDDPTADARLDAIRRVLHGCCRVVATVVGINRHELVWALPRMDRVVFPDRVMPPVALPADIGFPMSSASDAQLLALAEEVKAAEMAGQLATNDDDLDAATSRSVAVQKKMLETTPVTMAGLKAYARAAIWDVGRGTDGEPHPADSWGGDLVWRIATAILGGDKAKPFYAAGRPGEPPAPAMPPRLAPVTTSGPTFALIATEALRLGRQIQAMEDQGHDEPSGPFYTAYFGFSRAALGYEPASLAETMTLAAFVKEQAGTVATASLTEARSTEIGKAMNVALANVVLGIHRFGGVPMSAADPALDYLGAAAGAGL